MADLNFNTILELYRSGKSTYCIADIYNTYPNKIRRLLTRNGVSLRDKSDAQKTALDTGRASHPTEGKVRSEEERINISAGMNGYWSEIPDEEREKRSEIAKMNWDSMPEEKKEEMRQKSHEAIIKARHNGTKLEILLKDKIEESGYEVVLHDFDLLDGGLECDLHLPKQKLVIEIDGKQHRENRWGESTLERIQKADKKKDEALLSKGYSVIRIKYEQVGVNLYKDKKFADKLLNIIQKIPKDSNKIFHTEY